MKPSRKICIVAEDALKRSLAYKRYVKKMTGTVPKKVSATTFFKLPVTSKESFIKKYAADDLLQDESAGAVTYVSSGSSGKPSVWFRDEQTLAEGAALHRYIIEKIYGIKPNEPTLVLVTFSMGLWVAGLFTADAVRELRKDGFNITVATPGIDRKDGLIAYKNSVHLFRHVIIAGYPPYVMDFLRELKTTDTEMHRSLFLLTAGDKFSEEWRDEAAKLIGKPTSYERIISLYGSADAGSMAFETPATIRLRRKARTDKALYAKLFGKDEKQGGIYQFLPDSLYVEESGEELLITKHMPIPLVRYNIHDTGSVFAPGALALIEKRTKKAVWDRLPAVTISGRTDVAVTLYALNIYPDQIASGIPHGVSTGSYFAYTRKRKGAYSEELIIDVELKEKVRATKEMEVKIASKITEKLLTVSSEFKQLYDRIGSAAVPRIRLKKRGTVSTETRFEKKALLQISGKKPRLVIST